MIAITAAKYLYAFNYEDTYSDTGIWRMDRNASPELGRVKLTRTSGSEVSWYAESVSFEVLNVEGTQAVVYVGTALYSPTNPNSLIRMDVNGLNYTSTVVTSFPAHGGLVYAVAYAHGYNKVYAIVGTATSYDADYYVVSVDTGTGVVTEHCLYGNNSNNIGGMSVDPSTGTVYIVRDMDVLKLVGNTLVAVYSGLGYLGASIKDIHVGADGQIYMLQGNAINPATYGPVVLGSISGIPVTNAVNFNVYSPTQKNFIGFHVHSSGKIYTAIDHTGPEYRYQIAEWEPKPQANQSPRRTLIDLAPGANSAFCAVFGAGTTTVYVQENAVIGSLPPGTYQGVQLVVLTPIFGNEVRYTLDGSTPTISSPLYTGPLRITSSTVIKALAVYNGEASPVTTLTYIVTNADIVPLDYKASIMPLLIHQYQKDLV